MSGEEFDLALRRALATLGWGHMKIVVAKSFKQRLVGMLFVKPNDHMAMVFPNCRSLHTFGMRRTLDIAFVDAQGHVLALHKTVPPNRIKNNVHAAIAIEKIAD